MYIVCYFLLAYYTLTPKSKGNVAIKGVTFVLIASLVADETRQVGRLIKFVTMAFISLLSLPNNPLTYSPTPFEPTYKSTYLPI